MLVITPEQMEAFENASQERFKQGLRMILCELRPDFADKPPAEANQFVDQMLEAAPRFGFTTKKQITLFAVVGHDHGARFYEDRKYPGVPVILNNPNEDPVLRLEKAVAYMKERTPA